MRTLLTFMLAAGVAFGLFGFKLRRVHQSWKAVSDVEAQHATTITWVAKMGGDLVVRDRGDGEPAIDVLLDQPAGLDPQFHPDRVSDAGLENLRRLGPLAAKVSLEGRLMFSDMGLEHVAGLKNLRTLRLGRTRISNDGLRRLDDLQMLEDLDLRACFELSDRGLSHIARMKSLRSLNLEAYCSEYAPDDVWRDMLRRAPADPAARAMLDSLRGAVTDQGIAELEKLRSLKRLTLSYTKCGDEGLKRLRDLAQLEYLDLSRTAVTDAGLVHLVELTNLRVLDLRFTEVTYGGVMKLQQALPNCEILHSS